MVEFNRMRVKIGEPKLNEKEYLNYIYGKVKLIQSKNKLKSLDIPSWANDPRVYVSGISNYIATKKNDEYKKEISKQYTISIPFNKGAYQVLLPSEVKNAGRKV